MQTDVVVIGAGAAGLMCAFTAAARGRQVLLLDHANKAGKKILMSGGGRCNFTNLYTEPANFLSSNPHFCKSALARYTQWDFIEMVSRHGVPYHEKKLGQLFCDNKSSDILEMLLDECVRAGVDLRLDTAVTAIERLDQGYALQTGIGVVRCQSLVIATGGLSIPTLGASGFGYQIARQFGHNVLPTRAGLVPFTITEPQLKTLCSELSGTSVEDCLVSCNGQSFRENILFTHRGLSGPAILQISSYWHPGDVVQIMCDYRGQTISFIVNNISWGIAFEARHFPAGKMPHLGLAVALRGCDELQLVDFVTEAHSLFPADAQGRARGKGKESALNTYETSNIFG